MENQQFGQYLSKSEAIRHNDVLKYLSYVTDAAKDLGIPESTLYNISNPVILGKVVEKLKVAHTFTKRTKKKQQDIQVAMESLVRYATFLKEQ